MKKLIFIIATMLVIFTSCNKEDEPTDLIVGTWIPDKTEDLNTGVVTYHPAEYILEMFEDGTFTSHEGITNTYSGTWRISENTVIINRLLNGVNEERILSIITLNKTDFIYTFSHKTNSGKTFYKRKQ